MTLRRPPQRGDFGVTATTGWAAWVIRAVTRSTVNHAFVYVGGDEVIEGRPEGAGPNSLEAYPDAIWSHMDLTAAQRDAICAAALSYVGTPYNWVDVIGIGLTDLFGWHVPDAIKSRLGNKSQLFCSQLCDAAYQKAGIQLFPDGRVPGDVSPGDLLDLINKEPK